MRLAELLPDGPCLFVTDKQVFRLGLTDACRSALEDGGRLFEGGFLDGPYTYVWADSQVVLFLAQREAGEQLRPAEVPPASRCKTQGNQRQDRMR